MTLVIITTARHTVFINLQLQFINFYIPFLPINQTKKWKSNDELQIRIWRVGVFTIKN